MSVWRGSTCKGSVWIVWGGRQWKEPVSAAYSCQLHFISLLAGLSSWRLKYWCDLHR
jgi:hypothetical protein